MKNYIFILLLLISISGYSQRIYPATQTELIFSMASMNKTTIPTSQVVRFSAVINHESQLHVNFNKSFGYYTGFGIKNIGMINRFSNQDINFKQRAYAVSLPLAIKFGSVQKEQFFALGGELNFLFHYKEKFLYDDTKIKRSEWFSSKVNAFQPAVFLQIKYFKSQAITFKYFLNDFLNYQPGGLLLPDGTLVNDYGRSSHLFYISWASHLEIKDSDKKKPDPPKIRTARLDY